MLTKLSLILGALLLAAGIAFAGDKININTATATELQALHGIGAATARKIVKYREENGDFATIADIANVKGIGKKTAKKLATHITVSEHEHDATHDAMGYDY